MTSDWHSSRMITPSWSSNSRRIFEEKNAPTARLAAPSNMPPKPVFVCSGMGQQWWAMGRELLSEEPVYRRAIEEVSDLFAPLAGWSLLEKLTADEQSSQLQGTRFGQPAIFALQVALAALWRSWGVEPAAVLGHSAGEMAAAYIAGALSLEDAVRVAFHRSRLQHRAAGQGAMLAVGMSSEEAARLVERHPRAISIAAINGARSVTLSGDAAVLAEIDKALNAADVFSRVLQVDVPYHSPKMEQLEKELVECLRDIRPRPASTPFFSTVTGTALAGPELDAWYWYRNVREPVLFHETLGKRHRGRAQGIPGDRRASHSQARHRRVPERKEIARARRCARCAGRIASERRCWARSADCIRLVPRSIGASSTRPTRRRSSCPPTRFRRRAIGANPSRTVASA